MKANNMLCQFKTIEIARPDEPSIRRWILPSAKLIVINTAGHGGKIDWLLFNTNKIQ